jgi:hypothetical protein
MLSPVCRLTCDSLTEIGSERNMLAGGRFRSHTGGYRGPVFARPATTSTRGFRPTVPERVVHG